MKWIIFLIILLVFSVSVFGQAAANVATSGHAVNGKLISLTNIVPLRDCKIENFSGKVRNIDEKGDAVSFQLWEKKEKRKFELSLNRLAPSDRAVIFHDMIRKSFRLRIAGYACEPDEAISAFSIDLVY
ncbi:MAG: hypothetical protein ABI878_08690 [Acidobacteriota bacterium]